MLDENFLTIQGWMFNKLGLSGNEVIVYAIIYGFTQNGEDWFEGSLKYICESIGASKSTVLRILRTLESRGVIKKENYSVQGVTLARYKSCVGFEWGGVKMTPGGGVKMTPNNEDTKVSSNNNHKDISIPLDTKVSYPLTKKSAENLDDTFIKEMLYNVFPETQCNGDIGSSTELIKNFIQMRKAIKKPLVPSAFERWLKAGKKKAGDDFNTFCKMVEQSLINSWQGLFPLHNEDNSTKGKSSSYQFSNEKFRKQMEEIEKDPRYKGDGDITFLF